MKKLAFIGGAVGMGMLALLGAHLSHAADHLDAPAAQANPMGDIGDVYAWNNADATKVNLALTVSPGDNGMRHFGPTVLYAFHITSHAGFGMPGAEKKIICKFTDDTHGECWLTDGTKTLDYVSGDLSGTAGHASASTKFRVFAGRRSDPFFFNLGGVKNAISAAEAACGGACPPNVVGATDAAGCFKISKAQGDGLRALIGTKPTGNVAGTPCGSADIDCFIGFNVMAIVVQIDKDELLSGTDKILSVWASTHVGA